MDTQDQQPLGLTADVVRAVEELDLELDEFRPPAKESALKRISSRHHQLAKCLAQGMRSWEAAEITGYRLSTISILKSDPMFRELVKAYQEKQEIIGERLHEKLVGIASDAMDILADRLEEKPEEFSNTQLLEIRNSSLDRVGYGTATTQNTNVNIGLADRLQAARERVINLRPKEIANGSN